MIKRCACLPALCLLAAVGVQAAPADALRAQYAALEPRLSANQFNRPLVLDSRDAQNRPQGDIYAVVDYPFATVNSALNNAGHWCDVMLLHINTKYCHPVAQQPTVLRVYVGKKTAQELSDADRIDFTYTSVATSPDYFEIALDAQQGPLGTSGYRMLLQAAPLPGSKTFLHMSYGYNMNFAARVATQAYLGTLGRGKVGFTQAGRKPDGQADYIGGVRGIVERNTMRYYLAIDSYLAAAKVPAAQQLETSLQNWFSASETYARQLHEMERSEYLAMKRAEYSRQQVLR